MITGKKVVIKGVTKSAAAEIYRIVNKEDFRQLTGTLYPISEYEHEEWIKQAVTNPDQKLFEVVDRQMDRFLGTIGLKNFDQKNRNVEIFISLDSRGGYGADALATLVHFCFSHLNIHKIYAKVFASNTRSIHCFKKAGFQIEGVLKQHHFDNGEYSDVIIMGINRSDSV